MWLTLALRLKIPALHHRFRWWDGGFHRPCADFLIPSIKFKLFKRLQIAVICVYLRKISEYEKAQMHHYPLDRDVSNI